jgi:hypothetical protein
MVQFSVASFVPASWPSCFESTRVAHIHERQTRARGSAPRRPAHLGPVNAALPAQPPKGAVPGDDGVRRLDAAMVVVCDTHQLGAQGGRRRAAKGVGRSEMSFVGEEVGPGRKGAGGWRRKAGVLSSEGSSGPQQALADNSPGVGRRHKRREDGPMQPRPPHPSAPTHGRNCQKLPPSVVTYKLLHSTAMRQGVLQGEAPAGTLAPQIANPGLCSTICTSQVGRRQTPPPTRRRRRCEPGRSVKGGQGWSTPARGMAPTKRRARLQGERGVPKRVRRTAQKCVGSRAPPELSCARPPHPGAAGETPESRAAP